MFLMGMEGPFGNLYVVTEKTMPFPLLYRAEKKKISQGNGYDCGICWCLFMYDTILAFHHRPYIMKGGSADAYAHMGNYVHSPEWLKGKRSMRDEQQYVSKPLCKIL